MQFYLSCTIYCNLLKYFKKYNSIFEIRNLVIYFTILRFYSKKQKCKNIKKINIYFIMLNIFYNIYIWN